MSTDIKQLIVPPRKETLSANIAAQIKSLIFKKTYKPGDRLPSERELAALFDVSRVVVKQALLSLELSGFVEIKLGGKGGAFVTRDFIKPIAGCLDDLLTHGGVRISHFLDVRRALETAALEQSIKRVTPEALAKLNAINDEMGRPENLDRHAELNNAFHLALAEASGNPLYKLLLGAILENVFNYPGTSVQDSFIQQSHQEHQRLLAAFARGDLETAHRELIGNIDRIALDH